ncbi:arrestin domain-containing protein 3-like [Panulirus ornatus]|uniref:arrestin domain-containing protein 3-like n=1 Tax=Panulirus ornatus TaxID=150431 RepID=UPI003A8C30C0
MAIDGLLVVLQPNQPVYFPGQMIKGHIIVKVSSEVSCRGITVTAKGVGKVHWSERRGKTTHYYSSEEEYTRQTVRVWQGRDTGDKIHSGRHRFPFQFVLPHNIPSSFEATHGKVRYQVKAVADIPWGLDITTKALFSVNHLYDLNLDNTAKYPVRSQKEKTVCCCCCAEGPISLSITAARSGYVAGQNIVVNGEVVNNSRSPIKYTEAKIVQQIQYITPRKTKEEIRTVQRVYRPQIHAGGTDVWSSVPLPVPAVPASHLQHCNIIIIEYFLMFIAKLGACKSAKLKAPIVIGSVPLQNTYSMPVQLEALPEIGGTSLATSALQQPSLSPYQPTAPTITDPYSATTLPNHGELEEDYGFNDAPPPYTGTFMPDGYRDIPPPSYDSCVFSSGHDRALGGQRAGSGEDSDDGGFAPQYVTYRMGN